MLLVLLAQGKTWFAATQASRQTQQQDLMQGRLIWVVKRATLLFNSFNIIVAKEVASFCRPFFRTPSEQLF